MSSPSKEVLSGRVRRLEAEVTILRRLSELPEGGPGRERVYRFLSQPGTGERRATGRLSRSCALTIGARTRGTRGADLRTRRP